MTFFVKYCSNGFPSVAHTHATPGSVESSRHAVSAVAVSVPVGS